MTTADAAGWFGDFDRLRQRARADRHASSVPLLIFGLLTLGSAPLMDHLDASYLYWMLATPVGFALIAGW